VRNYCCLFGHGCTADNDDLLCATMRRTLFYYKKTNTVQCLPRTHVSQEGFLIARAQQVRYAVRTIECHLRFVCQNELIVPHHKLFSVAGVLSVLQSRRRSRILWQIMYVIRLLNLTVLGVSQTRPCLHTIRNNVSSALEIHYDYALYKFTCLLTYLLTRYAGALNLLGI